MMYTVRFQVVAMRFALILLALMVTGCSPERDPAQAASSAQIADLHRYPDFTFRPPSGWRRVEEKTGFVAYASPANDQMISFSVMWLDGSVPGAQAFQSVLDLRATGERQFAGDLRVGQTVPTARGLAAEFHGSDGTGRVFSGHLQSSSTAIVTMYVETIGPAENHANLFELAKRSFELT